MAANKYCVNRQQTLTAADLTVIQILAPTNINVLIHSVLWSFEGNSNTAVPILCGIVRQTSAGTGGTALVGYPMDERDAATIQSTLLGGAWGGGTEPSEDGTPKIVHQRAIHPQSAMYMAPLLEPILIKQASRLGFKCNAPAGVDVIVEVIAEE